jgi:transposase
MVVAAAGGGSSSGVAVGMGVSRLTVMRWRDRLVRDGCEGLVDEPRPGRPRVVGDEQVEALITTTLQAAPPTATR